MLIEIKVVCSSSLSPDSRLHICSTCWLVLQYRLLSVQLRSIPAVLLRSWSRWIWWFFVCCLRRWVIFLRWVRFGIIDVIWYFLHNLLLLWRSDIFIVFWWESCYCQRVVGWSKAGYCTCLRQYSILILDFLFILLVLFELGWLSRLVLGGRDGLGGRSWRGRDWIGSRIRSFYIFLWVTLRVRWTFSPYLNLLYVLRRIVSIDLHPNSRVFYALLWLFSVRWLTFPGWSWGWLIFICFLWAGQLVFLFRLLWWLLSLFRSVSGRRSSRR